MSFSIPSSPAVPTPLLQRRKSVDAPTQTLPPPIPPLQHELTQLQRSVSDVRSALLILHERVNTMGASASSGVKARRRSIQPKRRKGKSATSPLSAAVNTDVAVKPLVRPKFKPGGRVDWEDLHAQLDAEATVMHKVTTSFQRSATVSRKWIL